MAGIRGWGGGGRCQGGEGGRRFDVRANRSQPPLKKGGAPSSSIMGVKKGPRVVLGGEGEIGH